MREKLNKGIYFGIFLLSVAILSLEITFIRIFSISQYYHFAFMIVSIAFLGYGASGAFLSIYRGIWKFDIENLLSFLSLLLPLSIIISQIVINLIPFDTYKIAWDKTQFFYIGIYYVVLALPFFISGMCIAIILKKFSHEIAKVYFFNLLGSGIGCLLPMVSFPLLGDSGTIIAISIIAYASFISFSRNTGIFRFSIISLIPFILFVSLLNPFLGVKFSQYKDINIALSQKGSRILRTEWNSISRVDLVDSPLLRFAPGLSYKFRGEIPKQIGVMVDGNSLGAITLYNSLDKLEFTTHLPQAIAYHLLKRPRVLVIGLNGDLEILTALYHGAESITFIEPNPAVVNSNEIIRNLSREGKITARIDDVRSYLGKSGERFDIIIISQKDNLIHSSLGLYSMSEDYLFTREAFREYYEHLSDNGILLITKWLQNPPREDIRTISLAIDSIDGDARDKIIVMRSYVTMTIMIKKNKFTEREIRTVINFCNEMLYDMVYFPGINESYVNIYNKFPEPLYYRLTQDLFESRDEVYGNYLFDISPTTDDRPFFHHYIKLDKITHLYESIGKKPEIFLQGGFLSFIILIQAIILSIILILLPVFSIKKGRNFNIIIYFSLIGIGFMFIEVPLIQKFILFLGQPLYSVSIVIASLLVFSGIGSYLSRKFKPNKLIHILLILSTMAILYPLFLPRIFSSLLALDIQLRILSSIILLAPISLLMGIPFPLGIRITKDINNDLIMWAFCANACSSVIAPVLAVLIAMSHGFSSVIGLASLSYILSLVFMFRIISHHSSS